MALRKTLPVVLFVLFFMYQKAQAQQVSIVPDLSDVYVEKLVNVARNYYPKVKSTQNHINALRANVGKNIASFWEIFSGSYVYQPNQNTTTVTAGTATNHFTGYQLGVFLNLGTLLERPFLVKQSREELQIAVNDRDEYLITLATEVKKRYYIFLQKQAELKVQIKTLQDNDNILRDVRYKFEKGEAVFEIYNQAVISNSQAQISKLAAEAGLFAARADLEEMLGTKLENIK